MILRERLTYNTQPSIGVATVLGIFLDIETNGLDFHSHEVLEIAFKIVDLDSQEERASYSQILCINKEAWARSDLVSLSVNGFDWEKTARGKPLDEVKKEIIAIFQSQGIHRKNSVFICQNPSFDRPFFAKIIGVYEQEQMQWPYHWLDLASMYFTYNQQVNNEPPRARDLSKDEIAKNLGLPTEVKPHHALRGVEHLLLCYFKIISNIFSPV